MIDSFLVKNYKAFKEACIKIRPITIFLGANSVGKSSLLQFLLLLKQTATFGSKADKCPFKMYGPFANLGSVDNLFRNKNNTETIEITIALKNTKLPSLFKDIFTNYQQFFLTLPYLFPISGMLKLRNHESKFKNTQDFYDYVRALLDVVAKQRVEDFRKSIAYIVENSSSVAPDDIIKRDINEIVSTYTFLQTLSSEINKIIGNVTNTVSISFCMKENVLTVCGLKVSVNEKIVFDINAFDNFSVVSSFCTIKETDVAYIKQRVDFSTTLFEIIDEDQTDIDIKNTSTLSNFIVKIANLYIKTLREEFNPSLIQHIRPLRANPRRYYVIDDEELTPYATTLDGDRLIETLRDNETVLKKVNKWLENYNLSIKIERSEDVIHHLKIIQNNVELDIPDVGFGISQVLPVLVQTQCLPEKSITIIEQPEIHLHPIMQADIADLFRVSASEKTPLIIETHSEYLLRRIRRRVATKKMSSKDVSIYLFSGKTNDRDYTDVKQLDMTSTGAFEWPSDYYGGEMQRDIFEFISAQSES